MRSTSLAAFLLVLGLGTSSAAAQRTPEPRPKEATDSAVALGAALFHGSAGCSECHGVDAAGSDVAPPLTGALWFNGPGTYDWLVEHITRGIPAHRTMSGLAMPMRGWSTMTDAEVRAVAAYVWSITHRCRSIRPRQRRTAARR